MHTVDDTAKEIINVNNIIFHVSPSVLKLDEVEPELADIRQNQESINEAVKKLEEHASQAPAAFNHYLTHSGYAQLNEQIIQLKRRIEDQLKSLQGPITYNFSPELRDHFAQQLGYIQHLDTYIVEAQQRLLPLLDEHVQDEASIHPRIAERARLLMSRYADQYWQLKSAVDQKRSQLNQKPRPVMPWTVGWGFMPLTKLLLKKSVALTCVVHLATSALFIDLAITAVASPLWISQTAYALIRRGIEGWQRSSMKARLQAQVQQDESRMQQANNNYHICYHLFFRDATQNDASRDLNRNVSSQDENMSNQSHNYPSQYVM